MPAPQTIQRSDKHAQDLWQAAHDSAVKEYGEGGRAHRVAYYPVNFDVAAEEGCHSE